MSYALSVFLRGSMKIGRCFACNGTFLSGGDLEKLAHVDSGHVMNDILRLFAHKHSL